MPTKKKGPGRPKGKSNKDYAVERGIKEVERAEKGSDLDKAQKSQQAQDAIKTRHKSDLAELKTTIKGSMRLLKKMHDAGATDASAVGQVTRSMERLHAMEREAHGFNKRSSAIKAIILLPIQADSMEAWADAAVRGMGKERLPDEMPSRLVAPDGPVGED